MQNMISKIGKFLTNELDLSMIDVDVGLRDFSKLNIFNCHQQTTLNEYINAVRNNNTILILIFYDHFMYVNLSNRSHSIVSKSLMDISTAINEIESDNGVILLTENYYSDKELGDTCPKNLSIVVSPTNMYEDIGYKFNHIDKKNQTEWYVLCLNNNPRPHRVGVLLYLNHLGMNESIHSTFISKERWEENVLYEYETFLSYIYPNGKIKDSLCRISLESIYKDSAEYVNIKRQSDNYEKLTPLYENAIVEIVTESTSLEPTSTLTEKYVQSVIGKCFPIIIGTYKNVELYRNMGYDMFDDIIDHSYDFEPNPFYRMKMAIDNNIEILTNRSLAFDLYYKNEHRLDNNIKNYKKQFDVILGDTIGNIDAELSKFGV